MGGIFQPVLALAVTSQSPLLTVVESLIVIALVAVAIAQIPLVALFMFGGKLWRDRVARIEFTGAATIVIIAIAAIFLFVGAQSYQTFTNQHVSLLAFFTGTVWAPDQNLVGAVIPIVGTTVVTILAVLISTPISVGLAVFVTDVAPSWARRGMQPVLELFTGIPSIIYGFLGIELLVPLVRNIYNTIAGGYFTAGFGIIPAAIVLAVMILPTITTLSIDALASLPIGLREGSLALGSTRWQTISRTLIPAGASGIFTGIILGTGRAIGETLAVALVIGSNPNSFPVQFVSYYPYVVFHPTSTVTVQLLQDFKEATPGTLDYDAIWTLAFILLVISFLLVFASRYISSRSALRTEQPRGSRALAGLRTWTGFVARSAAR